MRLKILALVAVAVTANTAAALAGEACHQAKRSQCSCCPKCGEACYPTVSVGKEKRHCWEVDTKTICIPRVRFPWEKDCGDKGCCKTECAQPKCGRTKCVNVLLKRTYECDICKYRWNGNPTKQGKCGHNSRESVTLPKSNRPAPAPPQPEARNKPLKQNVSSVRFKTSATRDARKLSKSYEGNWIDFSK
jgi:hypothetical protein